MPRSAKVARGHDFSGSTTSGLAEVEACGENRMALNSAAVDPGDAATHWWDEVDRSLLLIVGVAFAVRLAWLLYARPVPVTDFEVHRGMAVSLADTFSYPPTADRLPVYIVFLGGAALISSSALWLGFVNVMLSTATCLGVYFLGREVFAERRPALVAAWVCALAPPLVVFSAVLATENLFALLMVLALIAAFRASSGSRAAGIGTGVLLGLAILTRGEAIFYIPVVAAIVVFGTAPRRQRSWVLATTGLMLVAVAALVVPWYVRNTTVVASDVGLSSTTGLNLYLGHNPNAYGWAALEVGPLAGLDPVAMNRLGAELAREYVLENPGSLIRSAIEGTAHLGAPPTYAVLWSTRSGAIVGGEYAADSLPGLRTIDLGVAAVGTVLLVTGLLAFVGIRDWPRRMVLLIPSLMVAGWVGHALVFYARARYRHFLDVVLTLAVAFVILKLFDRAGRSDEVS